MFLLAKASVENPTTNRTLTTLNYPTSPLKKVQQLCSRYCSSASELQGLQFDPDLQCGFSVHVLPVSFGFFRFPPTLQKYGWTVYVKLLLDVNVCVHDALG